MMVIFHPRKRKSDISMQKGYFLKGFNCIGKKELQILITFFTKYLYDIHILNNRSILSLFSRQCLSLAIFTYPIIKGSNTSKQPIQTIGKTLHSTEQKDRKDETRNKLQVLIM